MSLYIQFPIQQIADGLTAIGWSSAGGGGDATLSYGSTVPATPVNGTLWYDTTATLLKLYTGGTWTTINVSAETIATISGYVTLAQSAANDAEQKLTEFKAIQVTATTLSAGASATATFNAGTGVLTLGIPQGIQGIAGAVMSVAGRTGDVTLTTADISGLNTALASVQTTMINKPTIASPSNGTIDYIGSITTSSFSVSDTYNGNHDYTKWELSLTSDFSSVLISSVVGNLTSWTPSIGLALTQVYVRFRFGSDGHLSNWSDTLSFTTPNIYIQTPTLTVTGTPSDVTETPTLTTSAFSVYNGSDTHVSTDWVVTQGGTEVWSSMADTSNKTSIVVPAGELVVNTAYVFKARHNGSTYGASGWVEVAGTTLATFSIISGVSWNESNDTYSRTDGGTTGNAHIAIASQMKRCVLNANGTVNYYLDASDSTKKADGSAADLSGAAGNVMVEIPKFYYKYEYSGTTHTWRIATAPAAGYTVHPAFIREGVEVSYRYINAYVPRYNGTKLISASGVYPTTNQTRAVFRTQAAANGAGWSQVDWYLHSAIQLIYLVEYADFDTQTTIGMGRTQLGGGNWANSSYYALSGLSNSKGNGTFSVNNGGTSWSTDYMTYRGIEHWYGHLYRFIDGVNVQGSTYWVSNKPSTFADDVFSGDYANIGTAGTTAGYPSSLKNVSGGFLPNAVAGSTSVGLCDYYAYGGTGSYVVRVSGAANDGLSAGGFLLNSSSAASYANGSFASGLCR